MLCKNCGKKIAEDSKFCAECGVTIVDFGRTNLKVEYFATIIKKYKKKWLNMTGIQQAVLVLVSGVLFFAVLFLVVYFFQNNSERECIKMIGGKHYSGDYSYGGRSFPTMEDAIRYCTAVK